MFSLLPFWTYGGCFLEQQVQLFFIDRCVGALDYCILIEYQKPARPFSSPLHFEDFHYNPKTQRQSLRKKEILHVRKIKPIGRNTNFS